MRRFDTVIFDLDGTLLNTLGDLADAVNHALVCCGMPERTLEEVRQFVGNGIRNLMIRAVPEGETNPEFERAFGEFRDYYKLHCNDKTRPYPGVPGNASGVEGKGLSSGNRVQQGGFWRSRNCRSFILGRWSRDWRT